jgi:hypothetical protein
MGTQGHFSCSWLVSEFLLLFVCLRSRPVPALTASGSACSLVMEKRSKIDLMDKDSDEDEDDGAPQI